MKELPSGYKERYDKLLHDLIPICEDLMAITTEFGCDNFTVESDYLLITVKPKKLSFAEAGAQIVNSLVERIKRKVKSKKE